MTRQIQDMRDQRKLSSSFLNVQTQLLPHYKTYTMMNASHINSPFYEYPPPYNTSRRYFFTMPMFYNPSILTMNTHSFYSMHFFISKTQQKYPVLKITMKIRTRVLDSCN